MSSSFLSNIFLPSAGPHDTTTLNAPLEILQDTFVRFAPCFLWEARWSGVYYGEN